MLSSTEHEPSNVHASNERYRWLYSPRSRYKFYFLLALILFAAAYAALGAKSLKKGHVVSLLVGDGSGYYAYLPTILIDHDLDFRNQEEDQFGGKRNNTGMSYLHPQWPVGVAVTLVPPFLVAHAASWSIHALTGSGAFVPNGYSVLYEPFCCAFILALAACTMVLIDRILSERFNMEGPFIVLAVLAYWTGSHYLWYSIREPFMSHVVSPFWIAACVYIIHRMLVDLEHNRLHGGRLLLLAFCVSMALITRLTNAALLPLFIYLLYAILRGGKGPSFVRWLPVACLGLAPLVVQMAVWRGLGGDAVPTSVHAVGYSSEQGFSNWKHPYLLKTLFSSRHGLFFWAPILMLSALGVILYYIRGFGAAACPTRGASSSDEAPRGRFDPLLTGLVCVFVVIWYLNSAWFAWWYSSAFGGRSFLGMGVLFVIGLAFCYRAAWHAGRLWWAGALTVSVLGAAVTWTLMILWMMDKITRENYLF